MSKYEERKKILLGALQYSNRMDIKEVAKLINISEATARRMFIEMEKDGEILRTHGGIQHLPENVAEYSFNQLEQKHITFKKRIGEYASTLVNDNDIIFISSGTTLLQFTIYLAEQIKSGSANNITVFTNSSVNMDILTGICKVILIGGEYRPKRRDYAGFVSEKVVQHFNFTQSFLGADGIDLTEGIMATDIDTARLDEIIISRSDKTSILVDSSKIFVRSFVSLAPLNKIDLIVTDKNVPSAARDRFEDAEINIEYV